MAFRLARSRQIRQIRPFLPYWPAGAMVDSVSVAESHVPWAAQALVPASKPAAPQASYNVTITKAANGSVHYTVTH
jgi:hypothetical protein